MNRTEHWRGPDYALEIVQQPMNRVSCNYPLVEPGEAVRIKVMPVPHRSVRYPTTIIIAAAGKLTYKCFLQTEVVCQLFICGYRVNSSNM